MLKKHDKNELLIWSAGVLLFLLTLFISPIADDWTYIASPALQEFSLAHYRRLADVLIGMFLQTHPNWFPHINRVLIVVSHTVCAIMLYRISKDYIKVRSRISLAFAILFMIGGNTITTVLNYDCFNQTGSLMLGALGIYFFLKAENNAKKYAAYFVFCTLALCVKESAIVFFAIIPLMGIAKNAQTGEIDIKAETISIIRFYIPGLIFAALYYFSPIIQSQELWVYGSGFTLQDYAVGIVRRIVFSYTQVDQTSIVQLFRGSSFGMESILLLLCTLLSIPIILASLYIIIKRIKTKDTSLLTIVVLVSSSIIVFTPTLMATAFGSTWSQNHIVFFANLTFCYIVNAMDRKHVLATVSCIVLASTMTAASVYYQYYQTGVRQTNAVRTIESQLTSKDVGRYIVYNLNIHRGPPQSYPARLHSYQQIFDLGGTMRFFLGYDAKCTSISLRNEEFTYAGIAADSTKMDMTDEELLSYAQQKAKESIESGEYDLALVFLPTDEFYLYQADPRSTQQS